ncbi:hypothetical protein HMI54_005960 [Coelomomyces lativittatus]|nr:hypothetical protein HMI54_005960 [Coelomomyces lativittatus]
MNASTSSFAFHFFFFFWVVAALLGDFLHPSCIHGKHFTLASSNWLNSNIDPCFVKTEMGVLGLSHLYRKEADYFAYSDGDNQFYFNLCGPTVDPRCNGAGACLASRKKIQQVSYTENLISSFFFFFFF